MVPLRLQILDLICLALAYLPELNQLILLWIPTLCLCLWLSLCGCLPLYLSLYLYWCLNGYLSRYMSRSLYLSPSLLLCLY